MSSSTPPDIAGLDRYDRAILRLLQSNARISTASSRMQ